MRFIGTGVIAVAVMVSGCGTSESALPTPPASSASTPVSSPEQGTPPIADSSAAQGLLLVDAVSGDLLQMLDGEWRVVLDGPSYYDDTEMLEGEYTYIESATSAGDVIVAGFCCEPVVGALVAVASDGSSSMLGYGTRPVSMDGSIISFIEEYGEDKTVSRIAVTDFDGNQVAEYALSEMVAHGARMVAVNGELVLVWAHHDADGATKWLISSIAFTDDSDVDLTSTLPFDVLESTDLAAALDGRLYYYEVASDATTPAALYEASMTNDNHTSIETTQLLPGTYSVAVRDRTHIFQATTEGVFDIAGNRITPPGISPVWIGW